MNQQQAPDRLVGLQQRRGYTITGRKRPGPPAQAAPAAAASASAERPRPRRSRALPPHVAAPLGDAAAEYHKLLALERKVDLAMQKQRQQLADRLKAYQINPRLQNNPMCFPPTQLRLYRLFVRGAFEPAAAAPPAAGEALLPPPLAWTVRVWAEGGRRPDGFAPPEGSETAPVPLARAVSALHIECADASPAVIAAWPPPFTAADAAAGRRASADTVSQGVVVSRQTGAATELTVRIKLQVVGEKAKMYTLHPELAALLGLTPGQMVSGEEARAPAAPPPPPASPRSPAPFRAPTPPLPSPLLPSSRRRSGPRSSAGATLSAAAPTTSPPCRCAGRNSTACSDTRSTAGPTSL